MVRATNGGEAKLLLKGAIEGGREGLKEPEQQKYENALHRPPTLYLLQTTLNSEMLPLRSEPQCTVQTENRNTHFPHLGVRVEGARYICVQLCTNDLAVLLALGLCGQLCKMKEQWRRRTYFRPLWLAVRQGA